MQTSSAEVNCTDETCKIETNFDIHVILSIDIHDVLVLKIWVYSSNFGIFSFTVNMCVILKILCCILCIKYMV